MKTHSLLKKIIIYGIIASGIFTALAFSKRSVSTAKVDETNALTLAQVETKLGPTPQMFIFTGTHLMHLRGISDPLYEKAVESGKDSGQTAIYYKSELTGGNWYEVKGFSISEIYDEGRPIPQASLNPLFVQYYTGEDGITKDIFSMVEVGLFDIPDPYDLFNLPELKPLRTAYDDEIYPGDLNGDPTAAYAAGRVRGLFGLNVRSQETDLMDSYLNKLQPLYDSYKEKGDNDKADTVQNLMERVDSRRRFLVFDTLLVPVDQGYEMTKAQPFSDDPKNLQTLSYQLTGEGYTGSQPYVRNQGWENSESTSRGNCDTSRAKHRENMLKEGDSILSRARYRADMYVIESLSDDAVTRLMAVESIITDNIINTETELNALDVSAGLYQNKPAGLLTEAAALIPQTLQEGGGDDYLTGLANGESDASISGRLDERFSSDLWPKIEEFHRLITAKKDRMEPEDALPYVYERYQIALTWEDIIPRDDFYNKALKGVQDHEQWLLDLIKELQDLIDSRNGQDDDFNQQRDDLIDKRDEALDNNDPASARKYDAMIDALDDIIDRNGGGGTTGGDGSGNGSGDFRDKVLDDGLGRLNDGSGHGNGSGGDGTGGNGNSGAKGALDVLAALGDTDNADALADAMDDAGDGDDSDKDNRDLARDKADKNSRNNGSGFLSNSDMWDILASILGDRFENLDDKGKIIAAVAFGEFANTFRPARTLSISMMNVCIRENNIYAFAVLKGVDNLKEYTSISALAAASEYRYELMDDRHFLSSFGRFYSFKMGDPGFLSASGGGELLNPVKMGSDRGTDMLYISEEDTLKTLGCVAEYVKETDYGGCFSPSMESKKEQLLNALKDALNATKD